MNAHENPVEMEFEPMFAENEPITKHSARVLRKQILSDGHVSKKERQFLHDVLERGNIMDEEAFHILLDVLLNGKRRDS
jgi:hypothetical protein